MGIPALAQLLTAAGSDTPMNLAALVGGKAGAADFAALLAEQLPPDLATELVQSLPPGLARLLPDADAASPPGLALGQHLRAAGEVGLSPAGDDPAAADMAAADLASGTAETSSDSAPATETALSVLAALRGKDAPTPQRIDRGTPAEKRQNADPLNGLADARAAGPGERRTARAADEEPIPAAPDPGLMPERWIPDLPPAVTVRSAATNTPAATVAAPLAQALAAPPAELAGTAGGSNGESANLAGESPAAFANALAARQSASGSEAPAPAQARIDTPLHDPAWSRGLGDRVVWLARNDQQSAQISITPPQLGPIQITLNLNGDQASAVFASPHAEVRQAIQDALPQLRDMLSAAGINLGQANVGSQLAQQGREFAEQFAAGNRSGGENAILPADDQAAVHSAGLPLQRGRGMVDLFA
ncbi:flagellar hook-length control protein FliK [Azonexus sp.]|uniref:flagellar hook-length control protein FliK n=1 Tax=Azonexus sp. TaxID=1872668 RepID=UPI0035AE12B6